MDRYQRQTLLPQVGEAGQQRLAGARVLLVGCGALGTVIADQLVRGGIGHLRICDRDLVEETNLQRQVLFDENDARHERPKAVAAKAALSRVNSSVDIETHVVDVHARNIERLAGVEGEFQRVDLILDGTDNVQTRYLINDVAVKHRVPWVYAACVGVEGRAMGVVPGDGPCLRCLFEEPAGTGELATCDTAGVLGSAAGVVASLAVVTAMKILLGRPVSEIAQLNKLDVWANRFHVIDAQDARRTDCPVCGQRRFDFLDQQLAGLAASLCGRGAVQVRPVAEAKVDLAVLEQKLRAVGQVSRSEYFLRYVPGDRKESLTIFPDGRALIHGTGDVATARSLYSRYIGM
jgi:molybdopterin-synthase adenylyltransferase